MYTRFSVNQGSTVKAQFARVFSLKWKIRSPLRSPHTPNLVPAMLPTRNTSNVAYPQSSFHYLRRGAPCFLRLFSFSDRMLSIGFLVHVCISFLDEEQFLYFVSCFWTPPLLLFCHSCAFLLRPERCGLGYCSPQKDDIIIIAIV